MRIAFKFFQLNLCLPRYLRFRNRFIERPLDVVFSLLRDLIVALVCFGEPPKFRRDGAADLEHLVAQINGRLVVRAIFRGQIRLAIGNVEVLAAKLADNIAT